MRNISSNKDIITIAVICACCVIIFGAVVVLITRGKQDDFTDIPVMSGENGGAYVDENNRLVVRQGDYLPESCVGSWAVPAGSHVMQAPRNAAMSEKDALKIEEESEVLLLYTSYSTHEKGTVYSPVFHVTYNCPPADMDAAGMQSGGILEELGKDASLTKIEVYDESGERLHDTVFIVNDTYLLYSGTGQFVFAAQKQESVG